ncbi:MAG: DUF2249 domain-containing protein [Nibricoccus sp.]
MKTPSPLELDVRPLCAGGRPPMPAILDALGRLAPGQSLRLIAPFEPVPLYDFMGQRGFTHETSEREAGVWIILFTENSG